MVPHLPRGDGLGRGFKGAASYYLHDKGAATRERVGRTETANLATDDPDLAWRVMAATAMNQAGIKRAAGTRATGRKLADPVFAYSLSWAPDETPEAPHMFDQAKRSLAALGLSGHQALIVQHTDTKHPHVHILVNRVHPETGVAAPLKYTREKLSRYALEYEQKHGVRCKKRQENEGKRERAREEREKQIRVIAARAARAIGEAVGEVMRRRDEASREIERRQERERLETERRHDRPTTRFLKALDYRGRIARRQQEEAAALARAHKEERDKAESAARAEAEAVRKAKEDEARRQAAAVRKSTDRELRERDEGRRTEALREKTREQAAGPRPQRSRGRCR